jgi:hypothetical protein
VVSVSWAKGADIIACTVYARFLSASPLFICTTLLWPLLDILRDHEDVSNIPAYVTKGGFALFVLTFSTVICGFHLQYLMVIWPNVFGGERHCAIYKIVAMNDVGRPRVQYPPDYDQVGDVASMQCIYGAHNCMTTRTTSCDPHCFSS